MTNEERAKSIVDGFFIGAGGDSLEQPNLTKAELESAIKGALDEAVQEIELRIQRMQEALNKIHDLAGQMISPIYPDDAHPNLGAIQDHVHQVSPCEPVKVVAGVCSCGSLITPEGHACGYPTGIRPITCKTCGADICGVSMSSEGTFLRCTNGHKS